MAIWTAEIKDLGRIHDSFRGQLPDLKKELKQLISFDDPNVLMLYSRRCLEVIITDLCECELRRPRKTEPLKGIIDKLNKEEKVPSHIIASMHSLNSLSTYGTHPKDFDPEQVKPVMNNLSIVVKWYLKYKGIVVPGITIAEEGNDEFADTGKQTIDVTKLEKSVAILPFKNDSKDKENTYFINGLMEEVLNNLQKIKDLRVISRTSVEQYRNQTKPIPEIAKELGVNYIVEGSGQKYGNAFRLRTQLIMAAKETHLWGESYQKKINDIEDIFSVQTQIAESIAKELRAVITPQEKTLIEKVPTKAVEAYDAYLKGQFYWRKLTKNDLETALQYFELAKEKDQEYALAYAGISDVWIALQQMGYVSPDEAGPKAMEAIMKALELDSTLAQVHYSLALVRYASEWDWESGESEFLKTFAINPNYAEAHAYYSHLLNMVGRPKEAMEQIELALKLDPHNPLIKSMYGVDLTFVHRFDEAISVSLEALKMDPTNPVAFTALAVAFHSTGRLEEALESWKSYCCNTYKGIVHSFDQGYTKAGYIGAFNFEADTLAAQSKTTFVMPLDIAATYALGGNRKLAMEWFETGYEVHDPSLPYLLLPVFDSLRSDSRFQEIARKMNLPYK